MNVLRRVARKVVNKSAQLAIRSRPRLAALKFRLLTRLRAIHLYQPVPWLGFSEGLRTDGTEGRWQAIERELDKLDSPGTAMDLGAQLGYFSLRLAERNWLCLAVESSQGTYDAARLIQQATGISNVAYRRMAIDAANVKELPTVDVTIFLSLWHHLCRAEGFEKAKELLRDVLARTNVVCFFETGQSNEDYMDWAAALPEMGSSPRTWLIELLKECGACEVEPLGEFETFLGPVKRELLAAYTRPRETNEQPGQAAQPAAMATA